MHGVDATTEQMIRSVLVYRRTVEIARRSYLELIVEPDLSIVLFRRRGWDTARYAE